MGLHRSVLSSYQLQAFIPLLICLAHAQPRPFLNRPHVSNEIFQSRQNASQKPGISHQDLYRSNITSSDGFGLEYPGNYPDSNTNDETMDLIFSDRSVTVVCRKWFTAIGRYIRVSVWILTDNSLEELIY